MARIIDPEIENPKELKNSLGHSMFGIEKDLRRRNPKPKVSEMLIDVARDYIAMGDDIEEKQQLLNSAASAWNIACLNQNERKRAIKKYVREYKKLNPAHSKQDYRDEEENIKLLIKEKDRLYPDVKVQIAHAEAQKIRGKLHVTVMSMS
jgi:hypothetical protein